MLTAPPSRPLLSFAGTRFPKTLLKVYEHFEYDDERLPTALKAAQKAQQQRRLKARREGVQRRSAAAAVDSGISSMGGELVGGLEYGSASSNTQPLRQQHIMRAASHVAPAAAAAQPISLGTRGSRNLRHASIFGMSESSREVAVKKTQKSKRRRSSSSNRRRERERAREGGGEGRERKRARSLEGASSLFTVTFCEISANDLTCPPHIL